MTPPWRRAGVGMGSNSGSRLEQIHAAEKFLRALHDPEGGPFLISRIHETAPVDCPPHSTAFLNAVAELSTSLEPLALLEKFLEFECASGRVNRNIRNAPRVIDLDLLYLDDLELSNEHLTIPHPRMPERAFVLIPLAEISPLRILPGQTRTVADLAAALSPA